MKLDNLQFIGFGFLMAFSSNFGQTFFIGFYNNPICSAYDLSSAEFGLIYGFGTFCSAALILWLGRLIDHIDLRIYTIGVIVLMFSACVFLYGTTSIIALMIALCLLRLSGQGLMPHISYTSIGRYFKTSRGYALSLARLGQNTSQMILPSVAVYLIARVGWRESWAVYSLFLIALIPTIFSLLKNHKKRHEVWKAELALTEVQNDQQNCMKSPIKNILLKDPRFYFILPGYLGIPLFSTSLFFFQELLLRSKSWSDDLFAYSFPFFTVAMAFSTPLGGFLVDKLKDSLKLLPVVYLSFALSLVMLAVTENHLWLPLIMTIVGISSGLLSIIDGTLWAELYGTQALGSIRAFTTSLMVLSTAIIPAIMGYLYDNGLSINTSYTYFAGYMIIFAVVQMIIPKKSESQTTQNSNRMIVSR